MARRELAVTRRCAASLGFISIWCFGQSAYAPPTTSGELLHRVRFASGEIVGKQFHDHFLECDKHDTCDGITLPHGCRKNPNNNTALLRLPGGVIFFDAKMGIDADGSPLSVNNAGPTDRPVTSLRYHLPDSPSVNSDRVPYIVLPLGDFGSSLRVSIGDIAAVVYQGRVAYALVADRGPECKLGEGSIALHELLGHRVCLARDSDGDCTKLRDIGITRDVLYFIFPGSAKTIGQGLAPSNVVRRLDTQGQALFTAMINSQ
jgi:hypothetical protein